MSLSAALPRDWPVIKVYFAITIIFSVIGWTGLARVVRGKLLSLREEDFAIAARVSGVSNWRIITKHLLPLFLSYIIVSMTLAIPNMILGETALSFIGLGLQSPAVSWGVLLKDAQSIVDIALHPWKLIVGLFVIVTVLLFNFLGDGLRDAADPYATPRI
jgi:peptide/nickel transport system permease protein